ncbi:MAG: carboxypeptidase-like regulatory domain-containing protein, partial [Gemmatimonadota bacterium]
MNSRWSGPRAALLPGLFALVLWPVGSLWGQAATGAAGTVLGRVLDAETGAPQVGAFVALLDASEQRSAGALSDETGRFVLRVPEPGRYRLRVEGMGLESLRSPAFEVEAGGVQVMDLRTEAAAVRLTGLEVTGTARCSLDESDGSATVRLWDEARKSLEVAEWVDDVGYVYQVTRTRRILGPDAERVYEEESSRVTLTGRAAFLSIDAESLVRDGFVQTDSAGTSYYGPDASVLLSDLFLSAHCFQAVREDGRLGLAFEPGPDRDVPDIRGTLWIREEGGLDRLEYRYTGLPGDMD